MFDLTTCPSCFQYCWETFQTRAVRRSIEVMDTLSSRSKDWTAHKYLYSITQIASAYLRTPNGSNHTAPLRAMDLADVTRQRRHRFRNVQPRSLHEPADRQIPLPSIHAIAHCLLIMVRRLVQSVSVTSCSIYRIHHHVSETPTKSYRTWRTNSRISLGRSNLCEQ